MGRAVVTTQLWLIKAWRPLWMNLFGNYTTHQTQTLLLCGRKLAMHHIYSFNCLVSQYISFYYSISINASLFQKWFTWGKKLILGTQMCKVHAFPPQSFFINVSSRAGKRTQMAFVCKHQSHVWHQVPFINFNHFNFNGTSLLKIDACKWNDIVCQYALFTVWHCPHKTLKVVSGK